MYGPIYIIQNFRGKSLESSKVTIFLVESGHQLRFFLSGRDVKTSDSCRKLIFKQKTDNISFENHYNAQLYWVRIFYLF